MLKWMSDDQIAVRSLYTSFGQGQASCRRQPADAHRLVTRSTSLCSQQPVPKFVPNTQPILVKSLNGLQSKRLRVLSWLPCPALHSATHHTQSTNFNGVNMMRE
jgi:hypothetical protein